MPDNHKEQTRTYSLPNGAEREYYRDRLLNFEEVK